MAELSEENLLALSSMMALGTALKAPTQSVIEWNQAVTAQRGLTDKDIRAKYAPKKRRKRRA